MKGTDEMTIILEKEYDNNLGIDYYDIADKVINYALDYEKCPYEAEISLTLTNNQGIWDVNKEFRQIDRPTDVLSFPLIEYHTPGDFDFLEDCDECFKHAQTRDNDRLHLLSALPQASRPVARMNDRQHTSCE